MKAFPNHEVTLVADLPLSPIFPVQNPFNAVQGTLMLQGNRTQISQYLT